MKKCYAILFFFVGLMVIQQLSAQEQTDANQQSETFITKEELAKRQPLKISSTAATSLPLKMSYQGLLTTTGGAPVADGAYDLTVDLYDSLATGSSLWTEAHSSVAVQRGTFNITLGESTPLNLQFNKPLFVQVIATGGPSGPSYPLTFSPRSELTSAPYALAPWVTNGTNIYYKNGAVGLGTTAPESSAIASLRLEIADEDGYHSDMAIKVAGFGYPVFNFAKSRGSLSVPTTVVPGDLLGEALFLGHDGSAYRASAAMVSFADSTPGGVMVPGRFSFYTTNARNGWSEKMRLDRNGSLSIEHGNLNNGTLYPGLIFGGPSTGEGIASKRTAGGNQWGLDFYTSYQPRMSILNNGFVGIGTGTPYQALTVNGTIGFSDGTASLMVNSQSCCNSGTRMIWSHSPGFLNWGIFYNDTTDRMDFRTGPGGEVFTVGLSSGGVGVGTKSPDQLFSVNGGASKVGGGSWSVYSDRRLKQDINSFTDGLAVLKNIRPVSFRYNGRLGYPTDKTYIGVIAQEIQSVAPYTIDSFKAKLNPEDMDETDILRFDPNALTYISINAIKDLDVKIQEIEKLRQENHSLSSRLAVLEAAVEALMASAPKTEGKSIGERK
jgi:hypothetical protein